MSKITIAGDIHLRSVEKFGKLNTKTGLNTRTEDKLKIIKFVVDKSIEHGVKAVFFLGDVFDTVNPSEKLRSLFIETVSPLFEKEISVVVIVGNHEKGALNLHSFLTAKALNSPYFRVCDTMTNIEMDSIKVLLVPYGYENALYNHLLENTYSLMLSHIPIAPQFPDGIDQKFLTVEHIRNGHYHKADNIHIGSLCVCSRTDIDNAQSFEIINLENMYADSIPVSEREFIKINTDIDKLQEKACPAFDAVVSIKLIDTKEKLESVSIPSIKKLFPEAHKVVVEKEQIKSDKIVWEKSNDVLNTDIKKDIQLYCENKNKIEMEKPGIEIFEEALK